MPAFCNKVEQSAKLYNEAIDQYGQDNVDKSIELFKKAIDLNPEFYEAHYNLAQILMSVDRNEEALQSLNEIIKIKPNDSETLYNIGRIQYKRGYLSNAYANLKKIESNAPQYESAKILIQRIEKRQGELNLEGKITGHEAKVSNDGKAIATELGEFKAPSGIAVDNRGNIYVASFSENLIYKISVYGQKSTLTRSNLVKGPIGLAIDKDNNIYVANYSANNIVKIKPAGNASIFATIRKPYCITYDAEHNRLYVSEQNSNKLVKFDL